MATPPDNSGKPPAPPPGMPRISPVTPETAGRAPPAIPQVTAAAPKPATPAGLGIPKITAVGPNVPAPGTPRPAAAPPPGSGSKAVPRPPGSPGAVRPPPPPPATHVVRQPVEVPSIAPSIPTMAPVGPPKIDMATQPAIVRPPITANEAPHRIDLATQPAGLSPLFAQASQPPKAPAAAAPSRPPGAPGAVPRPAGAPGAVPRPPGAPGAVARPVGAPVATRPSAVAPQGPVETAPGRLDKLGVNANSAARPGPPPVIASPPPAEFAETATVLEAILVDEPPEAITQPIAIPPRPPPAPFVAPPAASGPAPVLRRVAIPETGAIEQVSPQQAAELKRLFEQFAQSDYFQVLQLAPTATTSEIKRAFYKESRIYHPDRIFQLNDATAKRHLGDIYKRITEAYYVLRDDAKRKKYLADLASPERVAKLRFTEASESEQKAEVVKAREEEFGTNPKARQFFKTALADIAASKWDAAQRNIKMALTFEPSNARFKEKLAEVEAKVEEHRKANHTGFTIK